MLYVTIFQHFCTYDSPLILVKLLSENKLLICDNIGRFRTGKINNYNPNFK